MGYAVIMFVILLLMSVSIALSANYGISKDSQKAPLLAENAYAEREGGKMQTDVVVEATKVNGTMYYSSVTTGGSQKINLHLTIKNNGSIVLTPLWYSILLNKTWVWINSTSDNSTYPLTNSTTTSLNLTQKPLNLTLSTENGIKITIPSPPVFTLLKATPNNTDNCWRDLELDWNPPVVNKWPIDHYVVYYTFDDNIDKNNVSIALTLSAETTAFIGSAYRKVGSNCGENNVSNQVYVWMTAVDTHGNEGVPSGTCLLPGNANGENCP
ncbi:MAG: hypothetical protein O8C60_02845 [Candidatus Methanoperedens sp.]|nr:hypothetical protein [Candidatus Methanoperedens sp.]